jgi:hypothetical protein
VRVTTGAHRHDDGTHHAHDGGADDDVSAATDPHAGLTPIAAGSDRSSPAPGSGRFAIDTPVDPSGHGAHSLAHRALATISPPPVITEPLPAIRAVTWVERTIEIAPQSPAAPLAVARGPPAA